MPFKPSDAQKHTKKASTDKLRRQWSDVANSVRAKCIADGNSEETCDAKGITQANGVIAKAVQESEMDNEWTMASVAQTAIEVGLAVARETGEIENSEAAKTLTLLRSKMNEIGEAQASIASIADVDVGGKHVSFAEIVEFYKLVSEGTYTYSGSTLVKKEKTKEVDMDEPAKSTIAKKDGKAKETADGGLISAYASAKDALDHFARVLELDVSLGDYEDQIRRAFYKKYASPESSYESSPYVRDVFLDHPVLGNSIIASYADKQYAVAYEVADEGFAFSERPDWKEVERPYQLVKMQKPSIETRDDVQVSEEEPTVSEPLIEFDEGDAESGTFEIDGHALMIVEDVDGASPAAPLKLNFVVIEPGFGNKKMKRYYPAPMLRENASKFKGAKMYTTNHKDTEKSVRTEAGIVLECPVGFTETGGVIGQAGIFDEAFARNVRNRAALGVLGSLENSVYGEGTMRNGKVNGEKAVVVESIQTVASVDWVTKAGAGGRALEIVENSDGGESIMMEEVLEEVAVAIDEPVVVEEAPPVDTIETEGDVQEMMIAEAVVATVDKANLPEAFKNALKVQEWADEASLEAGIAQAVEDYKAATGSGKPFGQGQPTKKKVAETDETPMERRLKRYNRILAEVGHSS